MSMTDLRSLGRTDLKVSPIGFGCFNLCGAYGATDETLAIKTLQAALNFGVTLFDTADFYGNYTNEQLARRGLGEQIENVTVSTKGGAQLDARGAMIFNAKPETIKKSCDASLRRLGVEAIDLYLLGRVDKTVPIEETVGAFSELVADGKVRNIGLCEVSASTIRRAHAVHPLTVVQNEYSLMERSVEIEVLPTLRELRITLMAYSPLGCGLLTGNISKNQTFASDDFRSLMPMFTSDNLASNLNPVEKLRTLAKELNVAPASLALAWLLAQGDDIIPIPGTRKIENLQVNLAAASIMLKPETVSELSSLFPLGVRVGDRYPEFLMAVVD